MFRGRLSLLGRLVFAVAGLTFLGVAFARTWDGGRDVVAPGWWRLLAALAFVTLAMSLAYRGWAALFPPGVRSRPLAGGFFVAQLGKYVPGAVWQAVGQVGYAARGEVSLPRAATAFAVFSLTQATAGAIVGATVAVTAPDLAWWLRLAALAAVLLAVLLDRRWMVWAIGVYRRRRPGPEPVEELVPSQQAILRSCAWSIGVMLAMGATFIVLIGGLDGSVPARAAVPAYALAWTAGFLAVPFPSGLGVREAALLTVLGPSTDPASLIAASVYFRLAQMIAEVLLILATGGWRRRVTARVGPAGAVPEDP